MEEKKTIEKKKSSPMSYVIAILVIAAIAYVYFCTDIIRTRPVSQEGSEFIGTYELEPSYFISDGEKVYNSTDLDGVPINCTLILKEDGTGSLREYNDNLKDETDSLTWKEVNGTAEIRLSWYEESDSSLVFTKEDSQYIMNSGQYPGYWNKTA